ncbi:MAG: SIS domain-containing protein [Candidatus Eisenbacteria bacterium]
MKGFSHFMLKEIFEQPLYPERDPRPPAPRPPAKRTSADSTCADEELRRHRRRIVMLACGTSWHAAMIGEYMLEEYCRRIRSRSSTPQVPLPRSVIGPKDLVIVISQSGETADTLAAMREAQRRGAGSPELCNTVGSTIAREADGGICPRRSRSAAWPAQGLHQPGGGAGGPDHLPGPPARPRGRAGRALIRELKAIPGEMERILKAETQVMEIAPITRCRNCLYLGRGYNFPVALEGR